MNPNPINFIVLVITGIAVAHLLIGVLLGA